MSSTAPSGLPGRTDSDLTTRARIRDAAVRRFPIDGFARTTVRGIAEAADVSAGLVIHHFGSKERLRTECDEHVIRRLGEVKRTGIIEGTYRQGDALAALYRLFEPEVRYLAWALGSGGAASAHIFDVMLEDTVAQLDEYHEAGVVAETEDPETLGAVLLSMRLGGLLLHEQMTRTLGFDTLSADGLMRLAPHVLQIFSGRLVDQRFIADAADALDEINRQMSDD